MIIHLIIILVLYAMFFIIAEFLYRRGQTAELTRKIVHIGASLVSFFLPFFLDLKISVMIGVFFVLLLFLTKRKNFFPSIHQVGGGNIGAPLFPLGLLVCAIIFWEINPLIFQGAVLIVGLSDGLAGILGQRFGKHSYYITGYKTIEGSLLFFLITLSILLSAFFYYKHSISPSLIFFAVISSLVLSFIEGFFGRGWDNLFIPPCAGLMIYLGFKFIL